MASVPPGRPLINSKWVIERIALAQWFFDSIFPGKQSRAKGRAETYHHSYVELVLEGPAIGLLSRTLSGNSGVAFTLGNKREEKMAIDYARTVLQSRRGMYATLYATKETHHKEEFKTI